MRWRDSLGGERYVRRTCMRSKITNSSRGFSSSRHFVVIARISYGKYTRTVHGGCTDLANSNESGHIYYEWSFIHHSDHVFRLCNWIEMKCSSLKSDLCRTVLESWKYHLNLCPHLSDHELSWVVYINYTDVPLPDDGIHLAFCTGCNLSNLHNLYFSTNIFNFSDVHKQQGERVPYVPR